MNWEKITVAQYQNIYQISKADIDNDERASKYLSILLNKTEKEVLDLPLPVYNKHCSDLAKSFTEEIPGEPQRYIRTDRLYRVNYEISTMRAAQYAEVKTFLQGGVIENLHLIMASVVDPVIDYVIWRKPVKNDSINHTERANNLLQAKFIDCYHTAVFFYLYLKNSISNLKDYLEKEMMTKMTKEQAQITTEVLMNSLDGFIQPRR
jgi:hypothetical protein